MMGSTALDSSRKFAITDNRATQCGLLNHGAILPAGLYWTEMRTCRSRGSGTPSWGDTGCVSGGVRVGGGGGGDGVACVLVGGLGRSLGEGASAPARSTR